MLVILGKSLRADRRGNFPYYECRCDCGNKATVHQSAIVGGKQISCGCRKAKHNLTDTPLYLVWRSMIARCHTPGAGEYHNYGARGIKVCDRWRHDFKAFLDDMGPRPDGASIDRIDFNGDYCPENCRWADNKTQGRNRRNNRVLEFRGERKSLSEWSEITGFGIHAIIQRLNRGWSVERALTEPLMTSRRNRRRGVTSSASS